LRKASHVGDDALGKVNRRPHVEVDDRELVVEIGHLAGGGLPDVGVLGDDQQVEAIECELLGELEADPGRCPGDDGQWSGLGRMRGAIPPQRAGRADRGRSVPDSEPRLVGRALV
jgi:hypothetical protein